MAQLGEQEPGRLAQVAGTLLRSGRRVLMAITPGKEGGRRTSGSPIAPPSQGRALLQQMQEGMSRAGRNVYCLGRAL
jgi:hypothetical protein